MSAVRTTRHSENNAWYTPPWLFESLAERIPFTVDVCASADDALAPRFGLDAIAAGDVAWINPPYGQALAPCLAQAVAHVRPQGLRALVALLPVRTSTAWWHGQAMLRSTQRVFIRGRLRFGRSKHNAPFDSVLVAFGRVPRIHAVVATRGVERVEWDADCQLGLGFAQLQMERAV